MGVALFGVVREGIFKEEGGSSKEIAHAKALREEHI